MSDLGSATGVVGLPDSPQPDASQNSIVAPNPNSTSATTLAPTSQQTYANAMTYGLPGLGAGLLDTLGQSIGVFDKNTMQQTLQKAFPGENSFGDFYSRNQSALRTGGEIAGVMLPGMVATKILRSVNYAREAGTLGTFLKNSAAADVLLGGSATLTTLESGVTAAASDSLASAGITAGRTFATPAVLQAKKAYYAARLVKSAAETAAFELSYKGLYGASNLFYPPDYSALDQLKWAGVGMVGGMALDNVMARFVTRNLLGGAAKQFAAGAENALSPFQKDIPQAVFRPGDRGSALSIYAQAKNDVSSVANTSGNAALVTNTKQDITNFNNTIATQIKNMAQDDHPIVPDAQLSDDQVKLGMKALEKNPTTFLYATKVSDVPDSSKEFFNGLNEAQTAAAKELNATRYAQLSAPIPDPKVLDAANVKYQSIIDATNEVHYVIENDGSFTPYRMRADNWLDSNSFKDITRSTFRDNSGPIIEGKPSILNRSMLSVNDISTPFVLNDGFMVAKAADFEGGIPQLSQEGYSALYAAGSKMIQDWKPVVGQRFTLNANVPWRQIEMTQALAKANPQAAALVDYTGAFRNSADADFHVLDQKYKEFTSLMPQTERVPTTQIATNLSKRFSITPEQVMQRLNLPAAQGMSPTPLTELFASARAESQPSLSAMFKKTSESFRPQTDHPLDLVQAALKEHGGLAQSADALPIAGRMLQQNDTKPLFVSAKSIPMLSRNDQMLHAMIENRRDLNLSRLAAIDPKAAPLVSKVTNEVSSVAASGVARQVETLFDGTLSGSGFTVGADRIAEQHPTLKAVQLMSQMTKRTIDNHVAGLGKETIEPAWGLLRKPNNKAKLFDANRIEQSYRHGWDIQSIEMPNAAGGKATFVLKKDSPINARLLSQHFSDVDVPEEVRHLMPDMSIAARKQGYLPLSVDPDSATLMKGISDLSVQSGVENNALRVALGQSPIKLRTFHLPTPELFKDGTWFVRNSKGDVIGTYTGASGATNKQRATEAAQKLLETTNEQHWAVPMEDVQRAHSVLDRNFFDVINYSDQLAKTNVGISGGMARTEIDTGTSTIENMITALHQQYMNVGVRARAAMFEPELNYARTAAATAGKIGAFKAANIFDIYQALMFGRSIISPTDVRASMYATVGDSLDAALGWLNQHLSSLNARSKDAMAGSQTLKQIVQRQTSDDEFKAYQKSLGEWSPFKDTADFMESTYREKLPPSARKIMAKISLTSSTMAIRFLDAGTALNNFAGLATNMPSVVSALRKGAGEDRDQWIARTGAWGTNWVGDTMTFSPMKAIANAARSYWNGDLAGPMAEAAKLGYFDPEYASLAKVLTTPTHGGKGALETWVDRASYLADHSEIMSRKISWGMGYRIGKELHGFDDEKNAYIFANNFVNDMIGNYDPRNKPGMFQGAIGLPLGAFQTYMFNFYRRLYGMMERGDVKSIAWQYSAMASMFGAKSVPGWAAFNSMMFSNYDGSSDISTRIDRAYASTPGVADLLLNGSLSGIPAIFGYDAPALYTRGGVDMTQPVPTLLTANKAPPIEFLQKTALGIRDTLQNIFGAGGYSNQEQEEILARMSTNRAFSHIMELASNQVSDAHGQAVQFGTRDAAHIAATLVGAEPTSVRNLQEAYSKNQQVQLTQSDMRAKLNDKTRALITGNELSVENLQDVIQGYTNSGGNPAYIGEWLRNTEASAVTPKAQAQMQKLAGSQKWNQFLNMLATIQQSHNGASQ